MGMIYPLHGAFTVSIITLHPPEAAKPAIPRLANIHDSTTLRVESKNDSDSTVPHSRFSNSNSYSTTRQRIRSAAAESSSSWSLGEYAVSIRSDFRSTASLPPHQPRQICRVHNTLSMPSDAILPFAALDVGQWKTG